MVVFFFSVCIRVIFGRLGNFGEFWLGIVFEMLLFVFFISRG